MIYCKYKYFSISPYTFLISFYSFIAISTVEGDLLSPHLEHPLLEGWAAHEPGAADWQAKRQIDLSGNDSHHQQLW